MVKVTSARWRGWCVMNIGQTEPSTFNMWLSATRCNTGIRAEKGACRPLRTSPRGRVPERYVETRPIGSSLSSDSIIDIVATFERGASVSAVNHALREASSRPPLKGSALSIPGNARSKSIAEIVPSTRAPPAWRARGDEHGMSLTSRRLLVDCYELRLVRSRRRLERTAVYGVKSSPPEP